MELKYNTHFKLVVNDAPEELSFLDLTRDIYLKLSGLDALVVTCIISKLPRDTMIDQIVKSFEINRDQASLRMLVSIKNLIGHGIVQSI